MEPTSPGGAALLGVGVDAEQVARFERHASGRRLRHVFSEREADHLESLPRPALALCAVFCIKEAVCKALGERYPFPECECLLRPGEPEQRLVLSPGLRERHGLAAARGLVHERFPVERGECVVEAHLFRATGARADPGGACPGAPEPCVRTRLESLEIAAVALRRDEVAASAFGAEEISGLGARRVQSLAGALALKRALAALWADAGLGAAEPRDFAVGHLESGAPRLLAAPDGIDPGLVRVSISHTRVWAYGLAALNSSGRG